VKISKAIIDTRLTQSIELLFADYNSIIEKGWRESLSQDIRLFITPTGAAD
jgi:hypothetical protein